MSKSRLVMTINTSLPLTTLRNILTDSSTRPLEQANKVINFFKALNAGARDATVLSGVADSGSADAVAASQTLTLSGAMTAADTVTINSVVLTAVASAPAANQFIVGVSASADAASLAAAINASASSALSGVVNASSLAGVVTVVCNMPGVIGNLVPIAKSSSAITLGGALLANGAGSLPKLTTFHFSRS